MANEARGNEGQSNEQQANEVTAYVEAIAPANRPLFDRVHGLLTAACPEATIRISYGIPTYEVGKRRLYVGAWQHGVSLYGWHQGGDGGFTERHPGLVHGRGTIRLRAADAAAITDDELTALAVAVLGPPAT